MKTTIATRMVLVLVCLLVALSARPASAQNSIGGRLGVAADPAEFYFGPHAEFGPIIPPNLFFKPNLEIGIGDNHQALSFNFEFAYHVPLTGSLRNKPFTPYVGAGPAFVAAHASGAGWDSSGAFNILFGLEHKNGLFGEIKFGIHAAPSFKLGIGKSWK